MSYVRYWLSFEFFTRGTGVKWGNRVFLMSTPPMIFEAGGLFSITDHLRYPLRAAQRNAQHI
jgi:hypothetical protein